MHGRCLDDLLWMQLFLPSPFDRLSGRGELLLLEWWGLGWKGLQVGRGHQGGHGRGGWGCHSFTWKCLIFDKNYVVFNSYPLFYEESPLVD